MQQQTNYQQTSFAPISESGGTFTSPVPTSTTTPATYVPSQQSSYVTQSTSYVPQQSASSANSFLDQQNQYTSYSTQPTSAFHQPGQQQAQPFTAYVPPVSSSTIPSQTVYSRETGPGMQKFQPGLPQRDVALAQTPVNDLELKKRMLDHQHETELKYADMEADKQQKYEGKAEKQRVKAAKWKGKGWDRVAHKHENKARDFEVRAHTHQIAAQDYKMVAKKFEDERKLYDPPSDKKKPETQAPGKSASGTEKKVEAEKRTETSRPAVELEKRTDSARPPTVETEKKTETTRPPPTVITDTRNRPLSAQMTQESTQYQQGLAAK